MGNIAWATWTAAPAGLLQGSPVLPQRNTQNFGGNRSRDAELGFLYPDPGFGAFYRLLSGTLIVNS